MQRISFVFFVCASLHVTAFGQELPEVNAPAGRGVDVLESQAKVGSSMTCEYEVRDVHRGSEWAPLIAIVLDEGKSTERDSKYLQLDMTFLADEDGTITHNLLNGGFGEKYEEPFLAHWQKVDWYSLELTWESDGEFRYTAQLSDTVVSAGRYAQPGFSPKYFRVSVSGLRAGIRCEVT